MNRYHTLERRLGALIVDLLIVILPIGAVDYSISLSEARLELLMPWLVVANFANAAYHIVLQGWYGQTLGKMLLGVKVVRFEDEGPIGMYRSLLREVPTLLFNAISFAAQALLVLSGNRINPAEPHPILSGIMFLAIPWTLAEIICALKTVKRRAIHDFIAGTVVIRTDIVKAQVEDIPQG